MDSATATLDNLDDSISMITAKETGSVDTSGSHGIASKGVVAKKKRGEYQELVTEQDISSHDANDEEDPSCCVSALQNDDSIVMPQEESTLFALWNRTLLHDQDWTIRGILLLPEPIVKFLKFFIISMIGIVGMHYLVQIMNWEHDSRFTLADMVLYEGNMIVLDFIVFFVVGQLYTTRGIDTLSWIVPSVVSAIYTSWSTGFKFLQHSFSLYDMHCHWPWKLWVFCALLIPLVVYMVWLHVAHAMRKQVLISKTLLLALSLVFWIVPYMFHPNFHLHHWYMGWLLGMHCNFHNVWWSKLTMAWLWGFYINGIAVYGRDPILTCAFSFYQSTDQHCPYMACYVEPSHDNTTTHEDHYKPMVKPNWRNCSGYIP